MTTSLHFRLATMADANQLLQWRNDSLTRQFSLNSTPITNEQHLIWLKESLLNPHRQLCIVELGKQPIGTTRIDTQKDKHTISWTLAPNYRGKGLAKMMVSQLVHNLSGSICAEILPTNLASIYVAKYAGLTYKNTKNGVMRFVIHR